MEFLLKTRDNVYPCEVTIDDDNGRYMIRKSDSSGEVFNSPIELAVWINENWHSDDFIDREQFEVLKKEIQHYLPTIINSESRP